MGFGRGSELAIVYPSDDGFLLRMLYEMISGEVMPGMGRIMMNHHSGFETR
jgi:hypothetical protein